MTVSALRLFLLLMFSLSFSDAEDAEVLCVHMESCVLPCRFDPGEEPTINWFKESMAITVHSHVQPDYQHDKYKGRTTLFNINEGNASLQLTEVKVQDEGKYICQTSTRGSDSKVSDVHLKLRAPVLQVSVLQEGQQLVCRSENIYPHPAVTWSSSTQQDSTISPSESGLFSVSSSVLLSDSENKYSCNISAEFDWRSATYWRNPQISFSDSAVTVKCVEPETPVKSLVWKFNCEVILTGTGSGPVLNEFWKPFIVPQTEFNSLVLKNLSQYQQGRYSCELSTESEDFIVNTELIKAQPEQKDNTVLWIGLGVTFLVLLMLIIVIIALVMKLRFENKKKWERVKRDEPDSRQRNY